MKKTYGKKSNGLKRFMAFVTAIAMVLGCIAMNAYADVDKWATTKTNNILQVKSFKADRQYTAYQLLYGDNAKGVLSNIEWGASVNDAPAMIEALKESTIGGRTNTVAGEFATFSSSSSATEFAQKIIDVSGKSSDYADMLAYDLIAILKNQECSTKTTGEKINVDDNDATKGYHYSFGSIHDGYYLVEETTAADKLGTNEKGDALTYSRYMATVAGATTIVTKAEDGPTVEKKIVTQAKTDTTNEQLADGKIAGMGDTVTFKLTSKVPGMKGYNKYFFIMEDTLSKSLDYDKDNPNMKVTVGTKELKVGDDYYVKDPVTNSDGTTTIKIVFVNFIQYTTGDDITVYYDATLNDKAVAGDTKDNYNKAKINYSNNPSTTYVGVKPDDNPDNPSNPGGDEPSTKESESSMGSSEWDTVYVYTGALKIIKIDETGNRLAGAKFKIVPKKDANGNALATVNKVVKTTSKMTPYKFYVEATDKEEWLKESSNWYIKMFDGNFEKSSGGTPALEYVKYNKNGEDHVMAIDGAYYHNTTDGTYDEKMKEGKTYEQLPVIYTKTTTPETIDQPTTATWEGVVGDDGELLITGLPAGQYEIVEVEAPSGYNKLASNISMKLEFSVNSSLETTWTYLFDTTGGTNYVESDQKADGGIGVERIKNNAGTTLPTTGGMGTKLFYLLGSILLIGASILLISKRRMNNNNWN
jgi:fimbrial isopeptide formation D2 family protein/LPXTG-motif cell wall-anchored protein